MLSDFLKKRHKKELELLKIVETLEPLDIIACTNPKSWISYFLRIRTNSDFSHVCLMGEHGTLFTTTIFGYQLKDAVSYLRKMNFVVYRHSEMDETKRRIGLISNYSMLDIPYGFFDVINLITSMFKTGSRVKKLITNTDDYFCAEAVAYVYEEIGLKLLAHLGYHPSAMTPQNCIEDHKLFKVAGPHKARLV